jgi:hypothetical protein
MLFDFVIKIRFYPADTHGVYPLKIELEMRIKSGSYYIPGFIKLQEKGMKCNKLYTRVYFFNFDAPAAISGFY